MNNLKVKVSVAELLASLNKNKEDHQKEYTIAIELYLDEVEKVLKEYTLSLTNQELREDDYRKFLTVPVDNSSEYDRYIGMLEMSQDSSIVIDTEQYNNFIKDDWSWALAAKLSNSVYLAH